MQKIVSNLGEDHKFAKTLSIGGGGGAFSPFNQLVLLKKVAANTVTSSMADF